MCRFISYLGTPEIMSKLLYEPENSIIKQSYAAKEIEEPLNGDGFGVGWYAPEIDRTPGVFVSITPAWNNRNLQHISRKVKSGCMLAHVRAASVGVVSESNCHPFQHDQYLMMHNGGIEHFDRIKRPLINQLSSKMYNWIQGQTDSECFFALFLDKLKEKSENPTGIEIAECLQDCFTEIEKLMTEHDIKEPAYFNIVVTDGKKIIGSRYVSDKSYKPLSLHHSEVGKLICEHGKPSLLKGSESECGVIVSSERLTEDKSDWNTVPPHHFIIVKEDLSVHFKEIHT